MKLLAIAALVGVLLLSPGKAQGNCYSVAQTSNTPTGIAGCVVWGEGIASYYGPGDGVAMNFCTWVYRHTHGCGYVTITSLDTNRSATVRVVDFCDCYVGTSNQRIVDLQYGVLALLGLNTSKGLYPVTVYPAGTQSTILMPDTATKEGAFAETTTK